jgi:transcriptional regulator with XRE-family HTH domain
LKNVSEIKSFGTHLRRLREQKQLSQQQLADISDVAKITIQRIENAKYAVTLDVLVSIAKGLKISLRDLFDFNAKPKK